MNEKLRLIVGAALLGAFLPFPARAFHLGLGSAVAGQGAKVVNAVANPIPSCGGNFTLFTQPPVVDANLVGVTPLGSQSSHILPPDHMYFNYNEPLPNLNQNLYAPSNGWVVQVTVNNQSSGQPFGINPNYYIGFAPCAEVALNFLEIATLSPKVSAALSAPSSQTTCTSFNHGGGGGNPEVGVGCVTNMILPVKAGDILGTGLVDDFGPLEDTRVSFSGFANPSRHDLHRGFCPLNYFAAGALPPAQYTPGINNGPVLIPRNASPVCGTIMQDVPGTAQGDWYFPGADTSFESAHLALDHDAVYTSTAVFSVGTSMPSILQGKEFFSPKTSMDGTRIDYDFNLVNDNQIYCYDSFAVNTQGGAMPGLAGHIVLVQLSGPSNASLTIEVQNPSADCLGAGTWAFTGAAVGFQR